MQRRVHLLRSATTVVVVATQPDEAPLLPFDDVTVQAEPALDLGQ
jgi:hypothetical protein